MWLSRRTAPTGFAQTLRSDPPGRRPAFTLVELLVVLAIVAVVAAILFPVLVQAREKARQTCCVSNLRQIGTAFGMYSQDYDETLCPNMIAVYTAPTAGRTFGWFGGYDFAFPGGTSALHDEWGLLWSYRKNAAIQDCPSAADVPAGNAVTAGNGYGYNAEFLTESFQNPGPPRVSGSAGMPLGFVTDPAETILLADAATLSSQGEALRSALLYPPFTRNGVGGCTYTRQTGGPSVHGRHNGMASVLWVDGHVTSRKPQVPTVALTSTKHPAALAARGLGDLLPGARTGDPQKDCFYFLAQKP